MRLGEILLESGIITDRQLEYALEYSHTKLIPLGQVVKLLKLANPEDLNYCTRTYRLILHGMPAPLAMLVLIEARSGNGAFDQVLVDKLSGPDGVDDELRDALLQQDRDKDSHDVLWLESPSHELLSKGDRFFEEEKFDLAEQCYESLLHRMEANEGEWSDALSPVLRRLANLAMVSERTEQAEELYARILEIKTTVYGRQHIDVASAYEDLADLYYAQKDFQRAENLFLLASSVHEDYLPSSLADFVSCLKKLLSCSKELEQTREHKKIGTLLTEAGLLTEEQLLRALRIGKQENLPLGAVLRQENLIDEQALQSFLEVQALIAEGILSGEAAARAYKGSVLAGIPLKKLLQDAGLLDRPQSGDKNLRLALINALDDLIAIESKLGPQHPDVAVKAYAVGALHEVQGNLLDAENFYRRTLNICNLDKKNDSALCASASHKLGLILLESNRPLQAEPLLMEALDLLQASAKAESLEGLEILQKLALLHHDQQNYAMCWNLFTSSLALAAKLNAVDRINLQFLEAFNHCATEIQREADAETIYIQTIRAMRKAVRCDDEVVARFNSKLGDFYRDLGKRSKARAQYEIALKLLWRTTNPDQDVLKALEIKMIEMR